MGTTTEIAWTDHTFNPWWGCTRVSPGCEHCYAEAFAKRTGHAVWGVQAERRFFGEKHWHEPLKWNAAAERAGVRARVFCASMADVFENLPGHDGDGMRQAQARGALWKLIAATPWLDWQLLTKRPENVRKMLPPPWLDEPRPNVWIGTTCENQHAAEKRIPILRQVPAAVRFLSIEPQLGPVDLAPFFGLQPGATWQPCLCDAIDPSDVPCIVCESRQSLAADMSGIDWVIIGGESGGGARPFDLEWARDIIRECKGAGVPVFFKQAGAKPARNGDLLKLTNRKGGDLAELPGWLHVREFPRLRAVAGQRAR